MSAMQLSRMSAMQLSRIQSQVGDKAERGDDIDEGEQ